LRGNSLSIASITTFAGLAFADFAKIDVPAACSHLKGEEPMELNANFNERVAIHTDGVAWTPSPIPGVDRRMFDRIGGEIARATSIVRYAPNSKFSPHVHTGGEEFVVLEGVFQDEHGDFPAGSYIRNPPESSHTPGSIPGCTIFVKLWQFDLADRTHVRIDSNKMKFVTDATRPGVEVLPLFHDRHEDVSLERWHANTDFHLDALNGLEVLVLDGGFREGGDTFTRHSWLRLPKDSGALVTSSASGARVWIKRNHLATPPQAPRT
jgi:anti-sigma factor ChrR (cupin superfamily)